MIACTKMLDETIINGHGTRTTNSIFCLIYITIESEHLRHTDSNHKWNRNYITQKFELLYKVLRNYILESNKSYHRVASKVNTNDHNYPISIFPERGLYSIIVVYNVSIQNQHLLSKLINKESTSFLLVNKQKSIRINDNINRENHFKDQNKYWSV